MTIRSAVHTLMLSPLYFRWTLQSRLNCVKYLLDRLTAPAA